MKSSNQKELNLAMLRPLTNEYGSNFGTGFIYFTGPDSLVEEDHRVISAEEADEIAMENQMDPTSDVWDQVTGLGSEDDYYSVLNRICSM